MVLQRHYLGHHVSPSVCHFISLPFSILETCLALLRSLLRRLVTMAWEITCSTAPTSFSIIRKDHPIPSTWSVYDSSRSDMHSSTQKKKILKTWLHCIAQLHMIAPKAKLSDHRMFDPGACKLIDCSHQPRPLFQPYLVQFLSDR